MITLQKSALVGNTLGLIDHFQSEEFDFIVTKKPRQTLLEYLVQSKDEEDRWFSERGAAGLLKPVFEAVDKLHYRGVVHRDICLGKIAIRVFDKKLLVQLHGFEHAIHLTSKQGEWTSAEQLAMTIENGSTTAPEILEGQEHGKPADIYGLGQVAYQLLCSTSSWEPQILQVPIHSVSQGEEELDELIHRSGSNFWQSQISEEVKELIARMV